LLSSCFRLQNYKKIQKKAIAATNFSIFTFQFAAIRAVRRAGICCGFTIKGIYRGYDELSI
jgi:hypothetical protein